MIRVLVADDHPAVREGLRLVLEASDLAVVGEAADGGQAVQSARELRPDVVLMDLRMPGLDGISATAQIVADDLTRVLVLTSFDIDDLVIRAVRAGAAGYLLKTADAATLRRAVEEVAAGGNALAPTATAAVLAAVRHGVGSGPHRDRGGPDPVAIIGGLTAREREVLAALARGLSNRAISERLAISTPTVKTHVSNVLVKLGVTSRMEAAALARRILDSPS